MKRFINLVFGRLDSLKQAVKNKKDTYSYQGEEYIITDFLKKLVMLDYFMASITGLLVLVCFIIVTHMILRLICVFLILIACILFIPIVLALTSKN